MSMTPSHKAVDVQKIPNGWNVKALGEIVSLYQPQTISAKQFTEAGYPVYGANGVVGNYHSANHDTWQVTVTCRGSTCGTVNRTVDQCWITGNAMVLNCEQNSALNKEFLYQLMLGQDLSDCITGTGQPQIVRSPLAAFRVAFPTTLDEQRAIATALSDVDALIAGLERLIAKKRDIKQAAMQQLLTGQTRLPECSGEWAPVQLGDLLDVCHGKNQHAVEVPDGSYPILATGGQIGTANQPLHDRPSVLIGRKGTINKPQYMDTPFWTVDTLFYCDVHPPNSAKFLYYRFLLIDWMQYNEASGVPSLNGRTIERIEIRCPGDKEQTAIATALSDMDTDLAALEARLAKTRAIKQGMMQELLTGRIRLV